MIYLWFMLIDLPLALLRVLIALAGPIAVTLALPFARNSQLPRLFSWWNNPDYGVHGNSAYLTKKPTTHFLNTRVGFRLIGTGW